jgi:hypothetical protein
MKRTKYISGSISKAVLLLLAITLSGTISAQDVSEKDTLRTYGPRFGIDLARFLYLFADPAQTGAEISADFEVYRNVNPVFELGYNSISDKQELFDYSSSGSYGRAGIDYNVLPLKDRSIHHSISVGFRYGMSVFTHHIEDVVIPNDYWGDYIPEPYENGLTGHWVELVGGMKAEVFANFFLGWSFRYKILLNPEMDPLMIPEMIPGFGSGGEERVFGFTYSIFYKLPLLKK